MNVQRRWVVWGAWLMAAGVSAAGVVDFDRDIRPILSDHCYVCHGPDGEFRKAELRLDLEEAAKAPLKDGVGHALVPGDPDASEAYRRISSEDPEVVMPPPKANKPLSAGQVETVRQWILAGAGWARHWAFVPPIAAVEDDTGADNPVDRLVRARLADQGLTHAPRADRRTLIRRLSLDLTGLPPTPEEIAAFEADASPGAYEALVDRLLASPRYGEHMARYWLDAVRYADTHGFHFDNYREIWPYRDWVIQAFNDNLPYDEFSRWQLAGDLLPEPTDAQRVATGYLRCNPTTNEGGIIDEEYRVEYAVDRVNNFGTVWLGLTVACAQCHDHKYDPITQEEYYQLFAYFDNTTEAVRDDNRKDPAPVLPVPRPEQQARLAEIATFLGELESRMAGEDPALADAQATWERKLAETATTPAEVELGPWRRMGPFPIAGIEQPYEHNFGPEPDGGCGQAWEVDPAVQDGAVVNLDGDPSAVYFARRLTVNRAVWMPVTAGSDDALKVWLNGRVILDRNVQRMVRDGDEVFALRLAPGANELLVKVVNFGGAGGFVMTTDAAGTVDEDESALVDEPDHDRGTRNGDWRFAEPPAASPRGGQARVQEAAGLVQHFYEGDEQAPIIEPGQSFYAWVYVDPASPPQAVMLQYNNGNWEHRAYWGEPGQIEYGRTDRDLPRYRYLGPLPEPGGWVRLEVAAGTVGIEAGDALRGMAFTQYGGRAWWGDAGMLNPDPSEQLARMARLPDGERGEDQRRRLTLAFRRETVPGFAEWESQQEDLETEQRQLQQVIPLTLVAGERDMPRETRVLIRGQYDQPGPVVTAGVPAVLPTWPASAPTNRLGLAQWLFDPAHPLTARVAVNRFWQQLFGVGLVKTSEDLGSQGERPRYPELLDELAVSFVESGWDIKALMRLIVTSETYQQSAAWPEEAAATDPENRRLARGPRFRLDAEVLRDSALYAAGLLVEQVGGPPVKPYQPEGIWQAVAFESSDTATYRPDQGDALHRRSIYTFWKRTAPPTTLKVLDAPSREYCVVRRERTDTPLAALALMNDVTFVEAARMLAQRTLLDLPVAGDSERIRRMFERATGRLPTDAEIALLQAYLAEQRATYARTPDRAIHLLEAGESPHDPSLDPAEHAAWTLVATLLLNLDESLNKG